MRLVRHGYAKPHYIYIYTSKYVNLISYNLIA